MSFTSLMHTAQSSAPRSEEEREEAAERPEGREEPPAGECCAQNSKTLTAARLVVHWTASGSLEAEQWPTGRPPACMARQLDCALLTAAPAPDGPSEWLAQASHRSTQMQAEGWIQSHC